MRISDWSSDVCSSDLAAEARRLIDISLDAGVTLFDTADVYSNGASEQILGEAIKGRRDAVLISTKTGLPIGDGPQDWGASRSRLLRAVAAEGAEARRVGQGCVSPGRSRGAP